MITIAYVIIDWQYDKQQLMTPTSVRPAGAISVTMPHQHLYRDDRWSDLTPDTGTISRGRDAGGDADRDRCRQLLSDGSQFSQSD